MENLNNTSRSIGTIIECVTDAKIDTIHVIPIINIGVVDFGTCPSGQTLHLGSLPAREVVSEALGVKRKKDTPTFCGKCYNIGNIGVYIWDV